MNLSAENIFLILAGSVFLGREIMYYLGKRNSFSDGYDKAINDINQVSIQNLQSAKSISEENEKLSDGELDDALGGGMFTEHRSN